MRENDTKRRSKSDCEREGEKECVRESERSQGTRHLFSLGNTALEHSSCYDYLGLKLSASGNFDLALNALKEKACKALYTTKRNVHKIQIQLHSGARFLTVSSCQLHCIM